MEEAPKGINEWEKASDEERWKMLNPESGVSKAENKPPEPKAPVPGGENQYDAVFSARREAEEESKSAGKAPELGSPAPKEAEPKTTPKVSPENRSMSPEEKTRLYKIQSEVANGKESKGKTIASPEAIENFVPVSQRVTELKESMVVGEHNKDTEDFLKMIAEPHERVGKMKEDKSGKTFLEKAKEVVSRGKEWLTRPWLRERLKGFATGGIWELWQGAKFQISARMTGKELLRANEKMEANKNQFTYDDAVMVHNKLVESGNLGPVDRAKFEQVANTIRKEKNMQYIDLVTAQARAKMKERLNWGGTKFTRGLEYRDRDGNKVQFDDAKLDQMMLNLRAKLIAMQDGAVKEDIKGFTGIIKKDLDPKYWKHYQYAAVDALLWTKGYLALNKYFAANAVSGSSEVVPPASGAEQIIAPPQGMDGTIWHTVDQVMQNPPSNMGLEIIPHPNLQQLTEASKYVVKGNGVGVDIWNIKGAPLDTLMQQGHPLDMNPLFDHWKEIVKLGAK